MAEVGLKSEHMGLYPHEFSGGQRQRIAIARSLSLKPRLIIADEAVSALDVSIRSQILLLLKELQKSFGLTYIFISHDLSVVRYISDRIAVMYLGRVVELSPKDEFFEKPLHPYSEALISAVPIPDPDYTTKRIVLHGDVPNPISPPEGCHFHPRCPYAKSICVSEYPPYKQVMPDHYVSCHIVK
jgi:oligopeptide/dipeptide ABC transporter ATP-binding protein